MADLGRILPISPVLSDFGIVWPKPWRDSASSRTMEDMAVTSDHYPLRAVFSFDVIERPHDGGRDTWGMAEGWKPKGIEQYHTRMRHTVDTATSLRELILCTEVSARAEVQHRSRGPHSAAEAEVSRLLRCRRASSTVDDRRKIACESQSKKCGQAGEVGEGKVGGSDLGGSPGLERTPTSSTVFAPYLRAVRSC